MKVGLIYKGEDALIANTAKKLAAEMSCRDKVFLSEDKMKKCDLIISLGGDGTTLRAARFACLYNIPILSIHLGGLGFLTEISLEDISTSLDLIKNKKYKLDTRQMLKAEVYRGERRLKVLLALNDAVISRCEISRTIKLNAYLKGALMAGYVADGLIASTPTGSTAYNFAVMGPILPTSSKAYILSPICPHRATDRPIVLHEPCSIEVVKGEKVLLTTDGQQTFVLKLNDVVKISFAKEKAQFIRFKDYDLWGLLSEKMGWKN